MTWQQKDWLIRRDAYQKGLGGKQVFALFLHGWGADILQGGLWHALADALAEEGVSSILLRMPYAAEDQSPISREEILHRIQTAERIIHAEGRLIWRVGFSMGALIAAYTRKSPERLLLISPAWIRFHESIFLPFLSLTEKVRLIVQGRSGRIHRDLFGFFTPPRLQKNDWIIHGWYDSLIPAMRSIQLARRWQARLIILPMDHLLSGEEERVYQSAYHILLDTRAESERSIEES